MLVLRVGSCARHMTRKRDLRAHHAGQARFADAVGGSLEQNVVLHLIAQANQVSAFVRSGRTHLHALVVSRDLE